MCIQDSHAFFVFSTAAADRFGLRTVSVRCLVPVIFHISLNADRFGLRTVSVCPVPGAPSHTAVCINGVPTKLNGFSKHDGFVTFGSATGAGVHWLDYGENGCYTTCAYIYIVVLPRAYTRLIVSLHL